MRLFIATPVILPFYNKLKERLNPYIKGKWVEENNLHITHKFIGDDNPKNWKINLEIPNEEIEIKGLGVFNNKILYAKATSPNIDLIAKQLNIKNFTPHVTLCRIKFYDPNLFINLIDFKFNIKIPFKVYLYSSILTNNGAIYKKIYSY